MGQGFQNLLAIYSAEREAKAQAHARNMAFQQQIANNLQNILEGFVNKERVKNQYKYMAQKVGVYDPSEPIDESRAAIQMERKLDTERNKLQKEKDRLENMIIRSPKRKSYDPNETQGRIAQIEQRQIRIDAIMMDPSYNNELLDEKWKEELEKEAWRRYYKQNRIGSPEYYETIRKYGQLQQPEEPEGENLTFEEKEAIKAKYRTGKTPTQAKPMSAQQAWKEIKKYDPGEEKIKYRNDLNALQTEYIGKINSDPEKAQELYGEFQIKWADITSGKTTKKTKKTKLSDEEVLQRLSELSKEGK